MISVGQWLPLFFTSKLLYHKFVMLFPGTPSLSYSNWKYLNTQFWVGHHVQLSTVILSKFHKSLSNSSVDSTMSISSPRLFPHLFTNLIPFFKLSRKLFRAYWHQTEWSLERKNETRWWYLLYRYKQYERIQVHNVYKVGNLNLFKKLPTE